MNDSGMRFGINGSAAWSMLEQRGAQFAPDRAFRTIAGAWAAVGSRFAASPAATIIFRLGIPGEYEGAAIGPYGSSLIIHGDPGNAAAYRIRCYVMYNYDNTPGHACCLWVNKISNFAIQGVTMVMDYPHNTSNGTQCLRPPGTTCSVNDCIFSIEVNNPNCEVMVLEADAKLWINGNIIVRGNNRSVSHGVAFHKAEWLATSAGPPRSTMLWENINFRGAGWAVSNNSYARNINTTTALFNATSHDRH